MDHLILAEKPSVARDLAAVFGTARRYDGYDVVGKGIVTWSLRPLVTWPRPTPTTA